MFQFPRFPLPALCVQAGVTPHDGCWVSPFGHPRINAWSTAPRGFSQSPTSFIGVRCQGIHRWLFVAWKNKDARTRYAVLKKQSSSPDARMPARKRAGSASQETEGSHPQSRREDSHPPQGTNRRPTSTYNRTHYPRQAERVSNSGVTPTQRGSTDSLERR